MTELPFIVELRGLVWTHRFSLSLIHLCTVVQLPLSFCNKPVSSFIMFVPLFFGKDRGNSPFLLSHKSEVHPYSTWIHPVQWIYHQILAVFLFRYIVSALQSLARSLIGYWTCYMSSSPICPSYNFDQKGFYIGYNINILTPYRHWFGWFLLI